MMEKVGTTWYGYKDDETRLQQRKDVRSTGKPYLLIRDENEGNQVDVMWELHNQGYSYGEIAKELEIRGFKNRAGNPVQKMTIYRVLKRKEQQKELVNVRR
jgi:hypothetical protein